MGTMAPSTHKSSLGMKTMPNRDIAFKNADMWLEDKRILDEAEGLWRVYNDLYDVADFIEKHPGGKFWLEVTKGTDITEAFESHHISTGPEKILKKYFVRKAKVQRNAPFTFEENGFYKTLKRRVRETLKTVPKTAGRSTKILIDILLISAFLSAIIANALWSFKLATASAILLSCTAITAHNFFHQRDNFRMYYGETALMKSREWRIIHVLSHHLYTNTISDIQAYLTEPMVNVYPESKSSWLKYASWIYTPLLIFPMTFYVLFFVRLYYWIVLGYSQSVGKTEFLSTILPLTMYIFGGQPLGSTVAMWLYIIAIHSFWFSLIAVATVHYHPDIFIDGDTPRPESERDWGINQLDTVSERYELTTNHFLSLLFFGDHALHHLFPTLDHGVLPYLYPVVEETMKEFNLNIRTSNYPSMLGGFFKQLSKDTPNPSPPDLLIYEKTK